LALEPCVDTNGLQRLFVNSLFGLRGGMGIDSDSRIDKFLEAVDLAVLDGHNMTEIAGIFFIRSFDPPLIIS